MVFSAGLEWVYQLVVGPIVLEEDDFTTMVRKIIAVIFGIATLFGGGSPYYGLRAFRATNSTNPEDVPYQPALIVIASTLFVFAFCMCLPVCLYVYCTKTAPDWILQYCIVMTVITTVMWDVSTVYFPIRATSLGLAFVSIGASLPQSKLIVVILALYYLAVEARDAWDISELRIQPPYEGGPIERFVTSMTGFFSLVMCCGLMGGMLFQYTMLLDNAAKSISLAKNVAGYLLMYDTDSVSEELADFERDNGLDKEAMNSNEVPEGMSPEEHEEYLDSVKKNMLKNDEGGNKRNKELVEVFREMANNLVRFRPHLPDYVLPQAHVEIEEGESGSIGNLSRTPESVQFTPRGGMKKKAKTNNDDGDSEGGLSYSTDTESTQSSRKLGGGANSAFGLGQQSQDSSGVFNGSITSGSGGGGRRGSLLNAQALAQMAANQQKYAPGGAAGGGGGDGGSVALSMTGRAAQNRKQAQAVKSQTTQAMFASMLKGAQHDNVVVARMDFERFLSVMLEGGIASEVLSPKINGLVAKILETAVTVDGTAHSFFEDSLIVSWNATRRSNQVEYKCCKFLTEIKNQVQQMMSNIANESFSGGSPSSSPNKNNNNNNNNAKKSLTDMMGGGERSNSNNTNSPASGGMGAAENSADSPNLGQTVSSNNFSFTSFNHQASVMTVAAVSGTAWCQVSGNEKKQMFTLSRFSSSEALKKMSEFARRNGFITIDQQVQSRGRIEFNIQGCGVVSVNKPEGNVFFNEQQQQKQMQQQQGLHKQGIMANIMKRRKSTLRGTGLTGMPPLPGTTATAVTITSPRDQQQQDKDKTVSTPSSVGNNSLRPEGSMSGPEDGTPSPLNRRNTAMFKKEFGWTSEAEKPDEDTGRMVVSPGDSAIALGGAKQKHNNSIGTTEQLPHARLSESPGTVTSHDKLGSQNRKQPNQQHEDDAVIMGNVDSSSTTTTTTPTNTTNNRSGAEDFQNNSSTSKPLFSVTNTPENEAVAVMSRKAKDSNGNLIQQPTALTPLNALNHHHNTNNSNSVTAGGFQQQANSSSNVPNAKNSGSNSNVIMGGGNSNSAGVPPPLDNNNNNNMNNSLGGGNHSSSGMLTLQNQYRNTYLVAVYELVGLKAGGDDDEWLYQVQDKDTLSGNLTDAVGYLAQGEIAKTEVVMNRLRGEVKDCEFNSHAYISIMECLDEIKLRESVLREAGVVPLAKSGGIG